MANFTKMKYSTPEIEKIAKKIILDSYPVVEYPEIIYLSGPVTGIDDYKDRFNEMYDLLDAVYTDENCIINSMDYINMLYRLCPDATYIDGLLIQQGILRYCTMVVVDDRSDKWINSRGVLTELVQANALGIPCYNFDYMYNCLRLRSCLDYLPDDEKQNINRLLKELEDGEDV